MKRLISVLLMLALLLCSCGKPQSAPAGEQSGIGDDGLPDAPMTFDLESYTVTRQQDITDAQREQFFELARTYRVDAMPYFMVGDQPALQDMKWYCAHLFRDELVAGANGSAVTGKTIERVAAEYFDLSFGLSETDVFPLEGGSFRDQPMMELVGYRETNSNGKTYITARLADYCFSQMMYNDKQEEHPDYATLRASVIAGKPAEYVGLTFYDVQYFAEEGKPVQFVACVSYGLTPDGYHMPAFEDVDGRCI